MVEAKEQGEAEDGADADSLARLAEASALMFAGQAAAMTMMTAFGLSLTGQMAGLMLGSVARGNEDGEAEPETQKSPASNAKVVPLRVVPKTDRRRDDLKQISGIGPRIEKALNDKGILLVSDIAGWDETAVAAFDTALGLDGRIVRDDWVGQARRLTERKH